MKASKLRVATAVIAFVILTIGLMTGVGLGTFSSFGWGSIAAICPLGALETMIATKLIVPRAVVSLVVMGVLVFFVGRAFCAWLCPVSVLEFLRGFFRSPKARKQLAKEKQDEALSIAKAELGCSSGKSCSSCSSCKSTRAKLDSRHYILGGALLSTAVFGFPVFCMVCPIGLTFGTALVIWRLFAAGDMTWSAVLLPALLVFEMAFLRKWCSRYCPMAALMNLMARPNKTFRPVIDDTKCLETGKGHACSRCAIACDHGINLRHIEYGEHDLTDCTRCRSCVEACPSGAISMPFLAKAPGGKASGGRRGKQEERVPVRIDATGDEAGAGAGAGVACVAADGAVASAVATEVEG